MVLSIKSVKHNAAKSVNRAVLHKENGMVSLVHSLMVRKTDTKDYAVVCTEARYICTVVSAGKRPYAVSCMPLEVR
jgi:hypothetical protein